MDTSNANASEDESFYGVFVETEADESGKRKLGSHLSDSRILKKTRNSNKIITFSIQMRRVL